MIIDAFMMNDELDMLEFRLRYLYDHVDKFVICEADHTHSGKSKALHYFNNKERFDWAKDKIIWHPVAIDTTGLDFSIIPTGFDLNAPQWKVENQQRAAIAEACRAFSADDVFMLSDCDEIPSHMAVHFRKHNLIQFPMTCDMRIVPYYLNYTRPDIGWRGTIMCSMKQAIDIGTQELRNNRIRYSPFPHGGWHLTYFGGANQIANKIASYAHAENNTEEFTDINRIDEISISGGSLFNDNSPPLDRVDSNFYPPEFLKHAPSKWWLPDYSIDW